MVYNVGTVLTMVGAGITDKRLIKLVANPIFPVIAISVMFLLILAVMTYKSSYDSKWKAYSVFSIITLSGVVAITFINRYMERKTGTSKSFSGGATTHDIPSNDFFNTAVVTSDAPPVGSFDDLFDL